MNYQVKVVKNNGIGTDSIAHLIGKVFDIHSEEHDGVVCVRYEGSLLELDNEEYEIV